MLISRRMMLAGLLAGVATPALAEVMDSSPRPVPRGGKAAAKVAPGPLDASDLIAAAKLGGTVAYVLMDAATGMLLDAREPAQALPPASRRATLARAPAKPPSRCWLPECHRTRMPLRCRRSRPRSPHPAANFWRRG